QNNVTFGSAVVGSGSAITFAGLNGITLGNVANPTALSTAVLNGAATNNNNLMVSNLGGVTINSQITGAGALTKQGTSTLTLTNGIPGAGASSYTGQTNLLQGITLAQNTN